MCWEKWLCSSQRWDWSLHVPCFLFQTWLYWFPWSCSHEEYETCFHHAEMCPNESYRRWVAWHETSQIYGRHDAQRLHANGTFLVMTELLWSLVSANRTNMCTRMMREALCVIFGSKLSACGFHVKVRWDHRTSDEIIGLVKKSDDIIGTVGINYINVDGKSGVKNRNEGSYYINALQWRFNETDKFDCELVVKQTSLRL